MLVFLLSHQRSGSHLLKHTLEAAMNPEDDTSASKLVVPPELFTPNGEKYPQWKDWSLESFINARIKERAGVGPEALSEVVREFVPHLKQTAEGKTAICDIKFNQLYVGIGWYQEPAGAPPILNQLSLHGKIIRLRRKNVLRAVVSGLVAAQTGVWHRKSNEADASPALPKLKISPSELLNHVAIVQRSIDLVDQWLAPYGKSILKVDYEDLNDPATGSCNHATFNSIARFMGLPESEKWTANFSKTGTYRLADVFEESTAIISALKSSPFASMLDDESVGRPTMGNGAAESTIASRFDSLLKKFFVAGANP